MATTLRYHFGPRLLGRPSLLSSCCELAGANSREPRPASRYAKEIRRMNCVVPTVPNITQYWRNSLHNSLCTRGVTFFVGGARLSKRWASVRVG